ncbi:hypothetical protein [Beijerinckia sp. L45]|uniref:hypothetical protein n=1 Tax=Beijerinckia sp. L45 TaxID=1641855 RepID=UPI00131AC2FA|nr:hypothetical protein [Beijerinckia sp. L45]
MTDAPMRRDEVRVAEALQSHFGVSYRVGENPPDIYLTFESGDVAVEISTLSQLVDDGEGGLRPRRSAEAPAVKLIKDLNLELGDRIPFGRHFVLVVPSPLTAPRKATKAARELLINMLARPVEFKIESELVWHDSKISVVLYTDAVWKNDKVQGVVSNNGRLGYEIFAVSRAMLKDSISAKAFKCRKALSLGKVWLVLQSDSFFATLKDLHRALICSDIENPFDKILFVERDGSISTIYEASPAQPTAT